MRTPVRRISQQEFGDISYEALHHVSAIHNQIGRFLDEKIYKRELAFRLPGVRIEEPIDVVFESFRKRYFLDVLVGDGAIFEFKAVESLAARHRAQLLHYLLLCNVEHGKLINVRPENVEHEFLNTQLTQADRTQFEVHLSRWDRATGAAELPELLTALLRDLGTGLEIGLYEEAVVQLLGAADQSEADVGVSIDGRIVGKQRFRLISPGVAFKVTSFEEQYESFEKHAQRLLEHTTLRAIAWINIARKKVNFTMLRS